MQLSTFHTYIIFQTSVDNFEIVHKTYPALVWGVGVRFLLKGVSLKGEFVECY